MDINFLLSKAEFLEMCFKLLLAAILSLVIGIERELKKKPVGLKTSLVIATFSCLLTIISIETAYSTPPRNEINITMDPLRLAAQVVSGIGFLGAGVILRRGNDSITGLTTAAMIWGAAAIGIAIGAGFYIHAILTVVIIVIGVEFVAPFLLKVGPKQLRTKEVDVTFHIIAQIHIADLLRYMREHYMRIEKMKIVDCYNIDKKLVHEVHIRFATEKELDTLTLYAELQQLHYIERIEIELIR